MGSFAYETALTPWNSGSLAGGKASLGEVFAAADDEARLGANSNSRWAALEDAYDNRNDAIFKATGQRLPNPVRDPFMLPVPGGSAKVQMPASVTYPQGARDWQERLDALAKQYPDAAEAIGAGRPIDEEAGALLQAAEGRSAEASASRPGVAGFLAGLAGGIRGSLRDPLQAIALVASGGESAAFSAGGRLIGVAGREALVNGLTEAAIQPSVQAWRKDAGVDSGFDRALGDVLMAAGFGAAFGTVAQGLREVVPVLRGLGEKRAVPSALRGAVDAIDADEAVAAMKLPEVDPASHDEALAASVRAAETGEAPPLIYEAPIDSANRELLATAPEEMRRVADLSRQRDINAAAIGDLQKRASDDATYAPVRRAMIEADAAAADAARLRSAAELSKVETERALLADRAASKAREADRLRASADPAKVQELADIETELKARREGQSSVEKLLAEAQAKIHQKRAPLLERFQRDRVPVSERPPEVEPTGSAALRQQAEQIRASAAGVPDPIDAKRAYRQADALDKQAADMDAGLGRRLTKEERQAARREAKALREQADVYHRDSAWSEDPKAGKAAHAAAKRLEARAEALERKAAAGVRMDVTGAEAGAKPAPMPKDQTPFAAPPELARPKPGGAAVNPAPLPEPGNMGTMARTTDRPQSEAVTTLRRALAGTADERAAAHRKLGEMVDALQRREDYDPKIHGQATVDLLTQALGGEPDRVVSSLARDAAGGDADVSFQRGLELAGRGDALSEMIDACRAG